MKAFRLYAVVVTVIAGLGFAGAAYSGMDQAKEHTMMTMPRPNAEAAWKYITKD